VTSNNFLADMLFHQLGGTKAFREFVASTDLTTHTDSLDIRNGSGYPIKSGETKFYNSTSCSSIVHSLELIDTTLQKTTMGLESVFPVATSDTSTLDKYDLPPGLMVAKTGTVNPTITFAGMIKTTQGPLYFSQLIKTDSAKDWPEARAFIKDYLSELIQTQAVALPYPKPASIFWGEGNITLDTKM
ncbi:MAG: D-alanyl-D-alanine carboxypeptidase, partial [Bdellovibrionaceae bacterium]|nr:D-alanyl-D-alanine carboxypeptidase [Pseudobdellovibrionaceae bacterium]